MSVPEFKVTLPTGKKTKPYSRLKIVAAFKGGKIPKNSTVDVDGQVIKIVDFCNGAPSELLEVETVKPAPQQRRPSLKRKPAPSRPMSDSQSRKSIPYALRRLALPEAVKNAYLRLPLDDQKAFEKDFKQRAKSTVTAYLAWLLLGWHYLYVRRVGMQFAFWFTAGFLIIGWFIDFFRVAGMVKEYNGEVARTLMSEQRLMSM